MFCVNRFEIFQDKQNKEGSQNGEPSLNGKDTDKLNTNKGDNKSSDKSDNSKPSNFSKGDNGGNSNSGGDSSGGSETAGALKDIAKTAVENAGDKEKSGSDKADETAKKTAKEGAKKGATMAVDAATGGMATAAKMAVKAFKIKVILTVIKYIAFFVLALTIGVKVLLGLLSFQYGDKDGWTAEELAEYKEMIVDNSSDDTLTFWDCINLTADVNEAINADMVTYSYADDWGLTGGAKTFFDFLFACPIFIPVNYFNNLMTYGSVDAKQEAYANKLKEELYDIMSSLGAYNPEDEFAAVLEHNYELCMKLAEKALKYAKDDCEDLYKTYKKEYDLEGYTITVGPNVVNARTYYSWLDSTEGPATSSDLFVDTNWGYLIATVDVLVEANSEVENSGTYDFEISDYTLYATYLEDEEPVRNLYHISSTITDYYDPEKEEIRKIVNFHVSSYTEYDLFHMSLAVNSGDLTQGNSESDYATMEISPESTWGTVTTFKQIVEARVTQMREILANDELIEKLGLEKEIREGSASDTSVKDYTSMSFDGATIDEYGDTEITIYKALTETYGYSPMAASVICGNIAAESGYTTTAVDSVGAHGLMQWQGGNWTALQNFANTNYDGDWTNLECQIRFMCEQYLPGKIPEIDSYSTLEDMTGYFALNAEKCSSYTYLYLSELKAAGDADNRSGGPCSCPKNHRWSTICWETGRYNKSLTSNSVVSDCSDSNQYNIRPSRYRYFENLHKYIVGGQDRYDAAVAAYAMFNGTTME